ncbi:MAG: hypothetical protein ACQCN4_02520 [Candidatus Bathyarchaeia archaeon]|jgi:hypothetical protein
MKIDVPDPFFEMLNSIGREMKPSRTLELLRWASENQAESSELADEYMKLKVSSKKEFQWSISIGNEPKQALVYTKQWTKRRHEQACLLKKVIADSKKAGYQFKMPNGVKCKIQYRDGEYRFRFSVAEEEVILFYSRLSYSTIEEAKEYGHVSNRRLYTIVYNDKTYDIDGEIAKALLQAIVQNISPKVAVVVSSDAGNFNGGNDVGR